MTDRRKRLNKGSLLIILIALAILIGLGVGWAECGLGRGDGESGDGDDTRPRGAAQLPAASDAAPAPCALRVASDGAITVAADGAPVSVPDAVAACRGALSVTLDVAGDAPFGAVDDLRKALEDADLDVREP